MNYEEKILTLLERQGEMLEEHGKILGKVQEDIAELRADVDGLKGSVSRLETDVAELKTDVANLKTDVSGIKVRLDLDISRQLNLLAEGHETLLETMVSEKRVEALEEDMAMVKSTIKVMGQEIAELKKAQ